MSEYSSELDDILGEVSSPTAVEVEHGWAIREAPVSRRLLLCIVSGAHAKVRLEYYCDLPVNRLSLVRLTDTILDYIDTTPV